MSKFLIVTRHTPLPWEDGSGAYLHDLASYLARHGFRVDVLWLKPHDHLRWQKIWRLPDAFDASVRLRLPGAIRCGRRYFFPGVIWSPFRAHTLHRIRRLLGAVGLHVPRRRHEPAASAATPERRPWASPPSPAELVAVAKSVRALRPDVVLASYAWMCPIFQLPALRGALHACLAYDVGWKRAALAARQNGIPPAPEVSREIETGWLLRARIVVAISASDAGDLRALAPTATVVVAPKAIAAHAPSVESGESHGLLFVGSDNAFNVEGLEWFLRDVWPQIRRETPVATLDVCGSINRAVTRRIEGVTFHGLVPSLDAHYQRAAVVIVPLLRATGMNIKLVDGAAFGRAIVTTPNTLVGAPFLRDAAIAAESPAEFATAIRRLLADPGARAAVAGRVLAAVQTHLAPAACYGPLATLLSAHR